LACSLEKKMAEKTVYDLVERMDALMAGKMVV
jgi:hypothetical protein